MGQGPSSTSTPRVQKASSKRPMLAKLKLGRSTSSATNPKNATLNTSKDESVESSSFIMIDADPNPDTTTPPVMMMANGHTNGTLYSRTHSTNGDVQSHNLKSQSYLSKRTSTQSLSKLFHRRRWRKKKRGSVSASFNMHSCDAQAELMNVNTASEEELMTLHGVNRGLARNIVNHRELIGGFRKIEDLALVSGMGASKLQQIRSEITVSYRYRYRPGLSLASSKAPSIESIPTMGANSILSEMLTRPGSSATMSSKMTPNNDKPPVNINQATIFDLMTVDGINQVLAARIIEYRDRKGLFRSVEDLRRVGGIHRKMLPAIRMYLTVDPAESGSPSCDKTPPIPPPRHVHKGKPNGSIFPLQSNTIQPVSPTALSGLDDEMRLVYELMSNLRTSARPEPRRLFNYYHDHCPAFRVASWNLSTLTEDKLLNPGVMEVLTRTILENRFSILAVQEVCDKNALQKICEELNEPSLKLNAGWTGYRGNWRWSLHPSALHSQNNAYYLGILYDSLRIDSVELPKCEEQFGTVQNGSLWQYSVFNVHAYSMSWLFVNVLSLPLESFGSSGGTSVMPSNGHVHGINNGGPPSPELISDSLKSMVEEEDGVILMGHFNTHHAQKGLRSFKDVELILPKPTEDEGHQSSGNSLWAGGRMKQYVTDENGEVNKGLSHLAIPNGWSWGGKVSPLGPLWCTVKGSLEQCRSDRMLLESDSEDMINDEDDGAITTTVPAR